MTPTTEGMMRQAGDANSRVGEAQAEEGKEGGARQKGYLKEWVRRLKRGSDEAGRRQT